MNEKLAVLWIDDLARTDDANLGYSSLLGKLPERGHSVRIVNDRASIIELLPHLQEFDVVVLDLLMPALERVGRERRDGEGGFDVLEWLAGEDRQGSKRPIVVVITVLDEDDVWARAAGRKLNLEAAGVVKCLTKGLISPRSVADEIEAQARRYAGAGS